MHHLHCQFKIIFQLIIEGNSKLAISKSSCDDVIIPLEFIMIYENTIICNIQLCIKAQIICI